ncbi:hypothetical protein IV73_GL000130 [Weissella kandleri]|uniref:SHOCT domain-containing protein n=1 Tax=Weissella kandleri TaxID=1616 RepID=A0A0R2JE68_9LACO|nr:SHOCT domain-containing protein [Weissella kandleri]KRN75641.1 hypothetical protein IV73_GL000130 [Weissella kandleri]
MSKIIEEQILPFDLNKSQKILDKTMVKYRSFSNNRTLGEVAFQWKAKTSYTINYKDDANTSIIITSKNFGLGPVQKNAVQKEMELFKSALRDSLNEVENTEQQDTKSSDNTAEDILKYKDLLDKGILTQEEFDKQKQKLLNK